MTKQDDEFLIDLDQPGLQPEEAKAPVKQAKAPVERDEAADDAIASMRNRLAAMEAENTNLRVSKAAAEQTAREQAALAARATGQAANSHYQMVTGHISSANNAIASLKQQIRAARAAGEDDTDLSGQLAKANVRLLQYEDAKADIEANARAQAAAPKEEAREEPTRNADPFETYVSTLSRESQGWLRQHRECVDNPKLNSKVTWAHHEAVEKGLKVDSPDYFKFLDQHMGYAKPDSDDDDDGVEIVEAKPEARRSVPTAPVSRGGQRDGQAPAGKVRLSREQVDMAESMGMTPREYAENLVKLTKEGRYPNVYN